MPGSSLLGVPDRPRLLPGVAVVRRDAAHLQVVLSRVRSLVVGDDADVRALLLGLADESGRALASLHPLRPRQVEVLRRLAHADLLGDAEVLRRDRAAVGAELTDEVHAGHGGDASRRLAARRAARVVVAGRCDPASPEHDDVTGLADLLTRSGVEVEVRSASAPGGVDEAGPVSLVVLVDSGPLPRSLIDPLLRSGTPHLVVAGEGHTIQVGPFAVPGSTACLRCVDAHHQQHDPRWGLVREQLAARPAHQRRPRPGAATRQLAIAWAAADVVRHLDGEQPATWSATLDVGGETTAQLTSWRRHPHCGCAWDELPYGA